MAQTCTNSSLYDSLKYCPGQTVLPGIRQRVYTIPKRDIVTWPTLPDVDAQSASLTALASYTGNFVLAADKKWLRIDLKINKGQIEWETQGEKPSRTFLNKITVSYPGLTAEAAGFARQAIADDLVFLVQQRDGKFRVLGSEAFENDIKPSGTTGEGVTGEASSDLVIESTDICPAPFYPGKIETKDDGDISGADGSIITE